MPKTYHRKTERAKWSPYAMLAAMEDVRQKKLTLHQSSVLHGVPRSTLNYRMKTNTEDFKAAYVRETVIGYKNEDLLVERIIRMQRVGFGLTANDIRRLAYEFAVQNNTPKASLFNAEIKIAGWDWYSAFMGVTQISVCGKVKQYLLLEHSA